MVGTKRTPEMLAFYKRRDSWIGGRYVDGWTLEALGGKFNITGERVRQILIRDKIPVRDLKALGTARPGGGPRMTEEIRRRVRKYVKDHPDTHLQKVANKMGVSYDSVKIALKVRHRKPKKIQKPKVTDKATEVISTSTVYGGASEALLDGLRAQGWDEARISSVFGAHEPLRSKLGA